MFNPRIIYSADEIRSFVRKIAGEINLHYGLREGKSPVLVVGVLRGAFILVSDLVRLLDFPLEIDFICASSYGEETVTSGNVKILLEPSESFEGRDILLVDDLIDTGTTLAFLAEYCEKRGARSVASVVLLDKSERRSADYQPDFIGAPVENVFLAGYGLDGGRGGYRQYPYIFESPAAE